MGWSSGYQSAMFQFLNFAQFWASGSQSVEADIENSKGYIRGNVIVISDRANRLKGDATLLELQRIADFYTRRVLEDGNRRFEAGLR